MLSYIFKKWKYVFFMLHAFMLLFVSLVLQKSYYLYKDEETIIQVGTLIKKSFLDSHSPDPDRFLFVNTSYDNQLIDIMDETGFIPLGNRPITDREKLTRLFETLSARPHYELIMCDVFFENRVDEDKELQFHANKLPDFLASSLLYADDSVSQPVLDIPSSLTIIEVIDDIFTKFKLSHGSNRPSMPLEHYLDQTNSNYQHHRLFPKLNNSYIINPFFLNLRITNYDLIERKQYPLINLGELLFLGAEAIHELSKDRIIVIGDFNYHDNVETYIGNISGPLILTNAYLALENQDMVIKPAFLLFLLSCFYIVSLLIFTPTDYLDRKLEKLGLTVLFKNIIKGAIVIVFFYFTSVLSFIIFDIHINILLISLYLGLIDYIIRYRSIKKQHKLEAKTRLN